MMALPSRWIPQIAPVAGTCGREGNEYASCLITPAGEHGSNWEDRSNQCCWKENLDFACVCVLVIPTIGHPAAGLSSHIDSYTEPGHRKGRKT